MSMTYLVVQTIHVQDFSRVVISAVSLQSSPSYFNRDVAVFIDNVIIGTETEEKHDDIIKKILRRMAENNLFVKLEKYIQKVREVRFLRVMIRLDGVEIEKEKVQGVVDWLVPKRMKYVQKFLEVQTIIDGLSRTL